VVVAFQKDIKSLIHQFKDNGLEGKIISDVDEVNETQLNYFLWKIENFSDNLDWKKFLVLWIVFKPNTDDIKESRAVEIIKFLLEKWANVVWFDYVKKAMDNISKIYSDVELLYKEDEIYNLQNLDWIIIAIEYKKFNDLDWSKIKNYINFPVIFDGRNILNKIR